MFYRSLSIFSLILLVMSLFLNIGLLIYMAVQKIYKSKTMFVIILCVNNILIIFTWDYTNIIHPFFEINYLQLNNASCKLISFFQYWTKEWHAWILVNTITLCLIKIQLNLFL